MTPIHVIGAPGAGKSYLAAALAERLNIPHVSVDAERIKLLRPGQFWPDDDRPAWAAIRAAADHPCVIETYTLSPELAGIERVTVLVQAPATIRHQRIWERARKGGPLVGNPRIYAERLMRLPEPRVSADVIWDGTRRTSAPDFDAFVRAVLNRAG